MQQSQQSEGRLVRVDGILGGPTVEQGSLSLDREGPAGEPSGWPAAGHAIGGVDQDQPTPTGISEELPQHAESATSGPGQGSNEDLDVVAVDQRPVTFAGGGDEAGKVTHCGEGGLDGVVGARTSPGPAGPFPVVDHGGLEALDRRPEACGNWTDPALTAQRGALSGVVGGQRQTAFEEEPVQSPGQLGRSSGPRQSPGPAGPAGGWTVRRPAAARGR